MKIKAPAKLNLSLNIFPQKRDDGLYPVKFLNCQLTLADEIFLKKREKGIVIETDNPEVPLGRDNLVLKAVEVLKKKIGKERGVEIFIKKHLPIKAGLGGGSSDAASVLNYLNKTWGLELSTKEILSIGRKLGMDVVYCLIGGLCFVSGAGEKIKKLPFSVPRLPVVVVAPEERKPSTAWAYQHLDLEKIGKNEKKLESLLKAIKEKNIKRIAANLHNDFEYSMEKYFPVIEKIKNELRAQGALRAMLCGSGLSVLGVFEDKIIASGCYNRLKRRFKKVFLTETR